jgi:hypothetical protein
MWYLPSTTCDKDNSIAGACTKSSLRNFLASKSRESECNRLSGGLKSEQPPAVSLLAGLEAIDALLGTEGSSPGIVSDETKFSAADGAPLRRAISEMPGIVAHFRLL